MTKSLTSFRAHYLDGLLEFLWRQWSALGIAGQERAREGRIMDPEALIAFSATVARWDARLFDEILGWLTVNGRFVNVQRLRRMITREAFAGGPVVSAMARLLEGRTSTLKWKRLAKTHSEHASTPLFYAKDRSPLPVMGDPDAAFAASGLLRNRIQLRDRSRQFPPEAPENLLLKLRALFGIQARCEILACLLGGEALHPPVIAHRIGYFHKTVQDALVDMARSGVVRVRRNGKQKRYWLILDAWMPLLAPSGPAPRWVCWPPLFSALERVWLKVDDLERFDLEPLLLSSELRLLMQSVAPDVEAAGFHGELTDERAHPGEAYASVFMQNLRRLIEKLNGREPGRRGD